MKAPNSGAFAFVVRFYPSSATSCRRSSSGQAVNVFHHAAQRVAQKVAFPGLDVPWQQSHGAVVIVPLQQPGDKRLFTL